MLVAVILHLTSLQPPSADSPPMGEYDIKASYLYNFTRFVEWPSEGAGGNTFAICVLGKDPFGEALNDLVGKTVRNRKIAVRKIFSIDEAQGCDILYISASERAHQKNILSSLPPAHGMLTVSDSNQFTLHGGMIGLVTVGGRIRFEINNKAAMQANLRISSHMLKLAVKIID